MKSVVIVNIKITGRVNSFSSTFNREFFNIVRAEQ